MCTAHVIAMLKAPSLGFDKFIISSTTPFTPADCKALSQNARAVVAQRFPEFARIYQEHNWHMFPSLDRVCDNSKARRVLKWEPIYTFIRALERLQNGQPLVGSALAQQVGSELYHRPIMQGRQPLQRQQIAQPFYVTMQENSGPHISMVDATLYQ